MMIRPSTIIWLFIFVCGLFSFTNAKCQANLPLTCGDVKLIIPVFQPAEWYELNNQYAVKAEILKPITEDTATIELRFNHFESGGSCFVIVIKAERDHFSALRYLWVDRTMNSDFPNLLKPGHLIYHLVGTDSLKFTGSNNWTLFFQKLINAHFFDSQSGNLLTLAIGHTDPKSTIIGECKDVWEIKVNKSYRCFILPAYYPEPENNPEYDEIKKIKLCLSYLQ